MSDWILFPLVIVAMTLYLWANLAAAGIVGVPF